MYAIRFLMLRIPIKVCMHFIKHESPADTEFGFSPIWFLVLSGECYLVSSA